MPSSLGGGILPPRPLEEKVVAPFGAAHRGALGSVRDRVAGRSGLAALAATT